MAIPSTPFNGCDCCGYGFEMFTGRPANPNWYLGSRITSPGNALQTINKSSGTRTSPTFFSTADKLIAVDDQNRLYFMDEQPSTTIKIIKMDASGNTIWEHTPSGGPQSMGGLVLDADRNVYVAFTRNNSVIGHALSDEAVVDKVDSDGNLVWTAIYRSTNGPPDYDWFAYEPFDINISGSRLHVTGIQRIIDDPIQATTRSSFFEWQLDTDGNEIWVVTDDEPTEAALVTPDDKTFGATCAFDSSGNIIVRYVGDGDVDPDYRLKSYDSSGGLNFAYELGDLGGSPFTVPFILDLEIFQDQLYILFSRDDNPSTPRFALVCARLSGSGFQTIDWQVVLDQDSLSYTSGKVRVDSTGAAYVHFFRLAQRYAKVSSAGSLVYSDDTGALPTETVPMIPPGRPPIFI